ncbi:MAG: 50S ribosomal protein L18 [Clostridia bacterium]|nr:50S ribosomal protein L18 [Clostridia bacterium]
MISKTDRKFERVRRHKRVRRKISGTPECPRLCVFRSNKGVYAQIIDDVNQTTLVAASTLDKEVKTKHANKEAAKEVGSLIAKRAKAKKISDVVFDRGGYIYHGVVKELADSAREGGLNF